MPIGDPGKESFETAIVKMRNRSILMFVDTVMLMRQEVASNDELQNRSGIDTTTQRHFIMLLVHVDRARRRITYNPENASPAGILDLDKADPTKFVVEAIDPKGTLSESIKPFAADEVQSGAGPLLDVPHALDGTDPNIQMLSKLNMRSSLYRQLMQAIDLLVVTATRLESRIASKMISPMDSARLWQIEKSIYEGLIAFGGDANKVDLAAGVRPSEEPRGPQNAANMATETAAGKPLGGTS